MVVPAPGGFLQATEAGEQAIADLVLAGLPRAKRVADLFAGCGPFSFRLAERAQVQAFESDKAAVLALTRAASTTQGLKPIAAEVRDLFRRPLLEHELNGFDAIVLDPPRAGAEAQAKRLGASMVPTVIYVSCDAGSFARAAAIIGAKNIVTDADAMVPYLKEWRDLFRGKARAVLRPGSTAEVAALVRLAAETGATLVPQGGNTGLVGGQIPIAEGREVILSLQRLDTIRSVDPDSDTMTVEAGLTLQKAQEAAEAAGRLFPLSLASEGSCTIGGNLSTNAGGTAVLAYGNARELCMGLEVVLADGRIWNGLRQLRKDNTGYDLKNLFIGAEGTLGIITAAVLKLFPLPAARATAFLAVPSPQAALAVLNLAKAGAGGTVTTFELMSRFCLEIVLRHASGTRDPLSEPSPWYVLMELS